MGDHIDVDVLADAVCNRVMERLEPRLDKMDGVPARVTALETVNTNRETVEQNAGTNKATVVAAVVGAVGGVASSLAARLFGIIVLVLLCGCATLSTPHLPTPKITGPTDWDVMVDRALTSEQKAAAADKLIMDGKAQIAKGEAELAASKRQRQVEEDAKTRMWLRWIELVGVLLVAAGAALAYFLPIKKPGFALGFFGAVLIGVALSVSAILPYALWIGLAAVLLLVGSLVWMLYGHSKVLCQIHDPAPEFVGMAKNLVEKYRKKLGQ